MEKVKVLCIIQARMGATRLPGKVLMKVGGISLLEKVVGRARQAKKIDRVVVATTVSDGDKKIERFCAKKEIDCFRGSETDVLDRFYRCALSYPDYQAIVRVTADCPLLDPAVVDRVIGSFLKERVDYASNIIPPTFPDGLDVEVFSLEVLKKMWAKAKKPHEREHVTAHIRENPANFKIANLNNREDLSKIRLTVDYREDIEFIGNLLELLPKNFGLNEIMRILKKNNALADINKKYSRHDGYDGWRKHCANFKKSL